MVTRPPNGGSARRQGAQDGASVSFPLLALGRSSADELGHSLAAMRKRERRERVGARVQLWAYLTYSRYRFSLLHLLLIILYAKT
jgi:hypothetical protein